MKINKIISAVSVSMVLSLAALQVYAESTDTGVGIVNPLGNVELQDIIQRIINFLFGLALAICPIFIIWGGFEIATAAGAEQKDQEWSAKNYLRLGGPGYYGPCQRVR